MDIEVAVSNYRCFADTPARFGLRNGLQSFVGVNNSGKSCLLRLFYELRNIFVQMSDQNNLRNALSTPPQPFNIAPMVRDRDEIFCDRNNRDLVVGFDLGMQEVRSGEAPSRFEIVVLRNTNTWTARIHASGGVITGSGLNSRIDGADQLIRFGAGPEVNLRPIADLGTALSKMLYLGPFRNTVNIGGSGDYYDIQIGQPFITNWRALKTGYQKKQSEATYRLTEDIRRIFGFETLDINASDDGQTLQLMIDEKSYKQSEIGSGLIQFIIVLVNAAIKSPSYILIDEPELSLHPSLQIDFLITLASYAEKGVLFATHNLGLARAVFERVYSVRRVGRYDREVRDFTGTRVLAEFLGEMGFNAYQDLGFETVLLVEGPTDVTCVQQLLRLYGKEHQVVLVPLGGNSMINGGCEAQLSEITRISRRVCALVDSERSQPGEALAADRKGFADVCSKLNIPCRVLERRAIENYFPEQAIRLAKRSDKYRALGHYEALAAIDPAWGKEENWRIARLMKRDDLSGTDLSTFLESL